MSVISVNNVTFKYKKSCVLSNIYARIPENRIYALLGPSGAGKTTLLRLILGRVVLQSGSIIVLGDKCGINNRLIGYMPQDCALSLQLNVKQTLLYFANLYNISKNKFEERLKSLEERLGVPPMKKSINDLSGGEQRQLSLTLALLHFPRLLILDEPTVGTDPELGDKIWRYLHESCALQKMSVLLVTHYTEEAHFAHYVGFMRDGRLIEEGVPQNLLDKFKEKSLENVFIRLCKYKDYQEDNIIKDSADKSIVHYYELNRILEVNKTDEKPKAESHKSEPFSFFWILFLLIGRNINKFIQYKLIFLMIFSPTFQTLLMCFIYSVDSIPIKTAVFNKDLDTMKSDKLFNFVKRIDVYYIKPIFYSSRFEAIDSVRKGYTTAAIIIDENFSSSIEDRVLSVQNNTFFEELEENNRSDVHVFIDNSNYIYSQFLIDSLTHTFWHFISNILEEKGRPRLSAPIKIVESIYAPDSKLSDFLFPGYLIAFIYLSQLTLSSILLINERNDGLFDRTIVAIDSGGGHTLVFVSHFITGCLMSALNVFLMLSIAFIWFDITNYGSLFLIVLLVMTQAANAIALGLLISSVCRESFVAFFLSLFIALSQLFTSGAIFPFESIEPNIRKFLYYSPIAMPTESLRNVMLRGWDLNYFFVLHGFTINIVSGIFYVIIAIYLFKKNS